MPSKEGRFFKPENITEAELPPEFDTTDRTGWHDLLGFGTAARRRARAQELQLSTALLAGIPEEFADRFQGLTDKEKRAVFEAGFRDLQARATPEFPERESRNPERRSAKIAEISEGSPEKRREIRKRTVRLEPPGHRPAIREYLVDLYTNDDGAMVCQCCRKEMPFRLDDGSYYFEAVEFDSRCDHELPENYLALCPVCAAKFKYARRNDETGMLAALRESEHAEIAVVLAGQEESIKFVGVHRNDLLPALGAVDKNDKRLA